MNHRTVRIPPARQFSAVGAPTRLLALLGAMLTTLVHAQGADQQQPSLGDLSMEELLNLEVERVYGASRYEQKVTRVPSAVTVVSAEEIRSFGYRNLVDVLRTVRGLYVSDDRNYSYLGIRGFLRPNDYNTRVLVLIDGHRINDNLFDSGTVAREGMVDIAAIERVEVIRGPSSSIYGSSAFFGVINVITRRGGQIDGAEVSADAGSFDTYRARLSAGDKLDSGLEWLVSAANYESAGNPRLYIPEFDQRRSDNPQAAHDGVAAGLDDENSVNLFGKMSFGDFGLQAFYSERFKQVPTASFGTVFNDNREHTRDYRSYVDLSFAHDFSADLNLQGRLTYDNYTYYGTYPFGTPSSDGLMDEALLRDGTVGEWIGTQWQLTTRLFDRHTLIVGGEYRNNIREYQFSYYDFEPRVYALQDDRDSQTFGVFAQDEVVLTSSLVLAAGVRHDYYVDGFGGTTNPRFGLIYNPDDAFTLKALYGEAFRAPNPYERYYNTEQRRRAELRPETIRTYELVAERRLGSHYYLSASAYRYDIQDLISQLATPEGAPYFDNLESAKALGVELEGRAEFASGAKARLSWLVQRAEDRRTGRVLSSSPKHLGKLSLALPWFAGKFFSGLDLQYHSASATLAGGEADDFLITNLTLSGQRLIGKLDVSLGIYNLFDTRYGYPGAEDHAQEVIEQDGRTLRASVAYRF
jgi:outer membrane receptor for ferrienterochelin and colicins